MCSDLLIDKMCSWRWFWKFCKTCRNISMTEFTVKEVTVFRVTTFWTKCSAKYNLLGIYEIFNITNRAYLHCQICTALSIGNNKFQLFKFRRKLNKLVVCKFYLIVHRFHARAQSLTCTTYGKYLRGSIMTVLTP